MKALLLPTVLIITALCSCKKEKPEPEQNPSPSSVYSLPTSTGSYWVYQHFSVDSLGNETPGSIDSLFILGDSVINGNTYVMYGNTQGPFPQLSFERDSAGHIVNQNGYILYSYVDLGDTMATYTFPLYPGPNSTYYTLINDVYMMPNKINLNTTPGVFDCYVIRTSHVDSAGGPLNACGDLTFNFDIYYASGIGKVRNEYAYFAPFADICQWRYYELIDYYIAP